MRGIINEFSIKIKAFVYEMKEEILVSLIIIFVGLASYGLGRLSISENTENTAKIEVLGQGASVSQSIDKKPENSQIEPISEGMDGQVVASKNGTKYHYPWCGGAKQISEKNKITFGSIEEARKAGYMPAGNCKGLK